MAARVTLICGNTQQGKSTLALRLALREWPRVIVLDSARSRVFDRISAGGQFASFRALALWLAGAGRGMARWCIALRSKEPRDYAEVLRCAEYMRGVLILCDETHKLCRMGQEVQKPLELCALTGAHYGNGVGVGLYMVAQRPGSVPINIRSQAERVITFRQREPRDIAWLTEWSGDEIWAASIAGLADHHHTEWPANVTVSKDGSNEVAALGNHHRRIGTDERGTGATVPGSVREGESGVLPSPNREVSDEARGAVSANASSDAAVLSAAAQPSP